jgi:murein DD-endopeptidase MepM/ murein hydrolase activator NlpD
MKQRRTVLLLLTLALPLAIFVVACAYVAQQSPPPESPAPPKPTTAPTRPQSIAISLPTPNQFLFATGREQDFYQPVEPARLQTAKFGCTRIGASGAEGSGFHEGIDIRCLQRDKRGEPTDPVTAIADGTVVYVNPSGGASNYGIYVVVRHEFHDAILYSLYAHLASVAHGMRPDSKVARGQQLGVMGRTSNDFKDGLIPKERAHLHLEICVYVNPHFAEWSLRKNKRPVEHGNFNGRNLIGLDPAAFILAAQRDSWFTVRKFLDAQTTAFTVLFDSREPIPFLAHNQWLLRPPSEPHPSQPIPAPVVAVEIAFDHTGLPLRAMPRRSNELTEETQRALLQRRFVLASVNEPELARNNCRELVKQEGRRWTLTTRGNEFIEILTFTP